MSTTAKATVEAALGLHRQGDLQRAEALYREALIIEPHHADAAHMLGLLALQTGRYGLAEELIRRALARAPRLAEAHNHLALALQELGRGAEAEAAFRRAIKLRRDWAPPWLNLGNLLAAAGRRDEAIAAYRTALAIDPADGAAHVNLAGLLAAGGDEAGAEAHYDQAVRAQPPGAAARAAAGSLRPADPPSSDAAIAEMLTEGVARHRAGERAAARELYEAVLRARPDHPDALHLLGLLAHERGEADAAVALIRRALGQRPRFPIALNNLGNVLRALGRREEAGAAYERALALNPELVAAELARAGLDADARDFAGAARRLEAIVTRRPALAQAWCDLGRVRREQRRFEDALAALDKASALEPASFAAHNERGIVLHQAGRWQDAVYAYQAALACAGDPAIALRNLGHAFKRLGRTADAIGCYRRASAHRDPSAVLDAATASLDTYATTSPVKLAHDIEQLAYLAAGGWRPGDADELIARYRTVLEGVSARAAPSETVRLTEQERALLGPEYNRLAHVADAPALPGGPFGSWDPAAAEATYLSARPELVTIDDFLSQDALAALRRYCLESTLWFNFSHPGGYLAALLDDRFDCPLLQQIADGLRLAMPRVLGAHSLVHTWAYKYDGTLEGVGIHGDNAAVNVNFWITPDDANLAPDTGGMIVYPAVTPDDWRFEDFNADHDRIMAFLAADGRAPIRVGYRANRAVVFNSSLFHETDRFRFKPGYETRRINITMLFGDRGAATPSDETARGTDVARPMS